MDLFAPWHIVIIVAIIVFLFGAQKIPELAKGLGEGMTEFKKATSKFSQELEEGKNQETGEHSEPNEAENQKQKSSVE
jgi:sec-independent protein translocase protein TatA